MGGSHKTDTRDADVVLIGGGIMSATLGSMLAVLEPGLRIVIVERADEVATESSAGWNNAGTGHAGYCELNYMPDPTDAGNTSEIEQQFRVSRQWWDHLARRGLLDPDSFLRSSPHMDVVFGRRDVDYLRRRFSTLRRLPQFGRMEYSEDPATIAEWAPLVTEGRSSPEPIAATRHPAGTDIDFGALTESLVRIITDNGGRVLLGHEVRSLRRARDRTWTIRGSAEAGGRFELHSPRLFVGAGGMALRLLQSARLPEVRGYGVLPVGAEFFRCSIPEVVDRHEAKVYGQADVGAPPMSVPHLDRRHVDGAEHLMFGPYATFSTKLLTRGRATDFFTTLRWHNLHVIAAALVQNLPLVMYLLRELASGPRKKFAKLRRYYPNAEAHQWKLAPAGQRAQLVTPDRRRIGVLQQGTELVVGGEGSIAGLLGASPGASTAVPIMFDLLRQWYPERWSESWSALVTTEYGSEPGLCDAETSGTRSTEETSE